MAWAAQLGDAGSGTVPSATLQGHWSGPRAVLAAVRSMVMSGLRARSGPGSPSSPHCGQAVGRGDRAIVGAR